MSSRGCCDVCGVPVDAEYFDESGILIGDQLPRKGEQAVMARFQVHRQYCGVLQCFAQFTDLYANDNSMVDTPGLVWTLRRNGQPIFPYHRLESIINPWGYGNYSFLIRLDEGSTVEFVLHNQGFDFEATDLTKVGGRIMGRYWYNRIYGAESE